MPKQPFKEPELPRFLVKRSEDFPAWLIVTCSREDCGERHLVKASTWLKPRRVDRRDGTGMTTTITGRACPYCFRPSRIPARSSIR